MKEKLFGKSRAIWGKVENGRFKSEIKKNEDYIHNWLKKREGLNVCVQFTTENNEFSLPWLRFIWGYVIEELRLRSKFCEQMYSKDEMYEEFKKIWFYVPDHDGKPITKNGQTLVFSLSRSGQVGESWLKAKWPYIQQDSIIKYECILHNKGEYFDEFTGHNQEFNLHEEPYNLEKGE